LITAVLSLFKNEEKRNLLTHLHKTVLEVMTEDVTLVPSVPLRIKIIKSARPKLSEAVKMKG
jgi:hypothetical protein